MKIATADNRRARPRGKGTTPCAVWTCRPGKHWPNMSRCADALGVVRAAVYYAVDRPRRACAGVRLRTSPPAWWTRQQARHAPQTAPVAPPSRGVMLWVRPGRDGRQGPPDAGVVMGRHRGSVEHWRREVAKVA
jgi:hypothetical protein